MPPEKKSTPSPSQDQNHNDQKEQILVVAGEISGDHLAELFLQKLKTRFHFFGAGGPAMEKLGVELLYHAEELSTIGILEALLKYRYFRKIMAHLDRESKIRNVKKAILVDFPGFNLRLAERLKKQGIQVMQISSPQIWASRYHRIEKIRKNVDQLLCFYPFEEKLYAREGIAAKFIGHPKVSELIALKKKYSAFPEKQTLDNGKKISGKNTIAILPGSRAGEINRHLQPLLNGIRKFSQKYPGWDFVIPAASDKIFDLLKTISLPANTFVVRTAAIEILRFAHAAVVASGTATLETAWMGTPFFLVYRVSAINYWLLKPLILIPYIGLVNVIAGRFVIPELIQQDFTEESFALQMEKVIFDKKLREQQMKDFSDIEKSMSSRKVGNSLYEEVRKFLS